jgi:sugar (pentulose or hexulose) kinase
MIAGVGVGVFGDFAEAARAWAPERVTLSPDSRRAAHYGELYARVYRPLCEKLAEFHHTLGELSGSAGTAASGSGPD